MQLRFYWRKLRLDVLEVADVSSIYVSIHAPLELVRESANVIAQQLRILDEQDRSYSILVEQSEGSLSLRYPSINGYVFKRLEDDPADVTREAARGFVRPDTVEPDARLPQAA